MKTKTLLYRLKRKLNCSWHEVARRLDITYSYVCLLRKNKEAGKHLKDKIENEVNKNEMP